jgi:hypothetical protein
VKRKLAYFHRYQTRARGLDEPETSLSVIKEEEDSNTKASGSWAAAIPRYENHEVGPRIDVWAEENTISSLMDNGQEQQEAVQRGPGWPAPTASQTDGRGTGCRSQVTAPGRKPDT